MEVFRAVVRTSRPSQSMHLAIKSACLRDLFSLVLERNRSLFLDVSDASLCHEDLHKHN